MPRTSLPWMILAAILVSAALAWWTLTRSVGGEPATRLEHRDLAPFHEIEVGGSAAVTLLQAQVESIDVEAAGRTSVAAEVAGARSSSARSTGGAGGTVSSADARPRHRT
jgi:hypothetical protein